MKILIVYFKELKKEDLAWCLLQAGYEVQIMVSDFLQSMESNMIRML